MIHTLLNLTRPLVCFDVESTGTNPDTDRIVQLGFQAWNADGVEKEWKSLVNPGVPIPPAATKVHGITDAMVGGCRSCGRPPGMHLPPGPLAEPTRECEGFRPWPRFRDLAPSIAKGFVNCDFMGKRVRFDLQITAAEMARAGVEWDYSGARVVDADRLEQLAVPRSLSDLYEKYVTEPCDRCSGMGFIVSYEHTMAERCKSCDGAGRVGKKFDGAHDALADVRGTSVIVAGQLEAHPNLPRDLDRLHAAQWPGWIDGGGKFRFVDGVPTCLFGKHRDKPMRSIPGDYWDWLLSADFPPEVKKLARDAKLGKFPEDKR